MNAGQAAAALRARALDCGFCGGAAWLRRPSRRWRGDEVERQRPRPQGYRWARCSSCREMLDLASVLDGEPIPPPPASITLESREHYGVSAGS